MCKRYKSYFEVSKKERISRFVVFIFSKMKLKAFLAHILFWLVIMLTYAASEWGYRNNFQQALQFELLYLPIRMIAAYVNWYILIPRWLYKNKISTYLLTLLIFLIFLSIAQRYLNVYWGYPTFFPDWFKKPLEFWVFFRIIQNLVIIASPVAFSTGIKLFMDWYQQKNKAKQLEIEKRAAELKYLKAQINPHFLFNTLNNLYGLSLEQSKKVPQLILKLSDLLSYSLYESAVERIAIRKEIKLINDFIALEKERYEGRLKIDWTIAKKVDREWEIAPLLLMPLVENAFKHGVKENIEQTIISLDLNKERQFLVFKVSNTVPKTIDEKLPNGIGLKNLKRRLDLLYPNQHQLETFQEGNQFNALLKLKIYEEL